MMRKYRYYIILAVFLISVGALTYIDPIPQDLAYHNFADDRSQFGISNFWNVISNLPMLFIGVWAMVVSFRQFTELPDLVSKLIPIFLSIGIITACFGSAYYHLAPENSTLFWDRLPMTLMFMPIFSLLIYDFIGPKIGSVCFYILLPLGIFSILYWQYTENIGQGDLRFYAFVQFFPMLIAPFILYLFPKKADYIGFIVLILLWYSLAKLCEHFDQEIFEKLRFWSGHTLKHLISGLSLFYVVKLLRAWKRTLLASG